MERGVVAIVCEMEGAAIEELMSFARAFHVPMLTLGLAGVVVAGHARWDASLFSSSSPSSASPSPAASASSYVLALRPPLASPLADLVRHFEWDALTYIYDSDAGAHPFRRSY